MDHLVIMKKSLAFLEKIKTSEKTVESRWYMGKRAPWNKITCGDQLYFKNSGSPVTYHCKARKVLQFDSLTPYKIKDIVNTYWRELGIAQKDLCFFYESVKNKKYCILVFLEAGRELEAFSIDKRGYGLMSAWICVENIGDIKTKNKENLKE